MHRLLIGLGVWLVAGLATAKAAPPAPGGLAWSEKDVVGKTLRYANADYDGVFQFEPRKREVAMVIDTDHNAKTPDVSLPCHWRLIKGRLEIFEQEEMYWSFELVARKPQGLVVKDASGKVLELKVSH